MQYRQYTRHYQGPLTEAQKWGAEPPVVRTYTLCKLLVHCLEDQAHGKFGCDDGSFMIVARVARRNWNPAFTSEPQQVEERAEVLRSVFRFRFDVGTVQAHSCMKTDVHHKTARDEGWHEFILCRDVGFSPYHCAF